MVVTLTYPRSYGKKRLVCTNNKGVKIITKRALILANIILILTLVNPTIAESPFKRAKAVKSEINGMRKDLSKAFQAYEDSKIKLEKLHRAVSNNTAKLQRATVDLKRSETILSKRINSLYRYGHVSFFDIIFEASTFNEMLVNMDFLIRVGKKDTVVIQKVKRLKAEITTAQKHLNADRASQRVNVKNLKEKKGYIDTKLSKAKKQLKGLEKEIKELSKPKPLPPPVQQQITAPSAPPAATNGNYAFPSGSPYGYSNDWGAPRGGGTRRHQGNDILAPMGTPAYAVTGGTIGSSTGGSAGLWITLRGDDGNAYFYMHMQSVTASGHVSAGQQIGTVGNTGNALGGPAHIHFELHPGGGGAVNPYFFLTSIQ